MQKDDKASLSQSSRSAAPRIGAMPVEQPALRGRSGFMTLISWTPLIMQTDYRDRVEPSLNPAFICRSASRFSLAFLCRRQMQPRCETAKLGVSKLELAAIEAGEIDHDRETEPGARHRLIQPATAL